MNNCKLNLRGKGCLFCTELNNRLICCHKPKVDDDGFGWVDIQHICPLALRSNMKTDKAKRRADKRKEALMLEGRYASSKEGRKGISLWNRRQV